MKKSKIKKVLITLDYNQSAQKVAEVGYEIAHSMGAEISLLHVLVDPIYYVNMIIMGSHSQKWLEKIVMGSVSENVLKCSNLPILIIPTSNKSN